MKKLFTLFIAGLFAAALLAQTPQKMSYQAVVRNAAGALVTGQGVGMKISILQGSTTGSLIYQEIYNPNPQTNENGLLTLEIGEGIPLTGTFSTIDWSNGPYYLMTETDPSGSTNYTISGTSQLLSVPYALYANSAENYTETDPLFDISTASGITGANISDWNAAWSWGDHASAGYVPDFRSLTINGTALDLSEDRSYNVGTVTSVGIALPDIFSLAGSPITASGTITATLTSQKANLIFASPIKEVSGPPVFRTLVSEDIPALNWSKITSGKPTTLAGYGITDGLNTQTLRDTAAQIRADIPLVTTHSVGESYGGGIIFWVDETGQHGLIAATADKATEIRWNAGTDTNTMALADGDGAGKSNTAIIIANQGYGDGATYAARICNEYSVTVGEVTYGDWYLPSKYELNLLCLQKDVVGGFVGTYYWSSTEKSTTFAWSQNFNRLDQEGLIKYFACRVRAVRTF